MKKAMVVLALLFLITTGFYAQKHEYQRVNPHETQIQKMKFKSSALPALHRAIIPPQEPGNSGSLLSVKQRLDSCLNQAWDNGGSQWMDADSKSVYTYDAAGKTLLEADYSWDESTSKWIENSKAEYSYDGGEKMTKSVAYEWDETADKLVATYKSEITYDGNGRMIEENLSFWDEGSSQWYAIYKEDFTYDENGLMTETIDYEWDLSSEEWIPGFKDVYSYDQLNRIISDVPWMWEDNPDPGCWISYPGVDRFDYTYSAEGYIIEELQSGYDDNIATWLPSAKTIYSYNATGQLISRLGNEWDDINKQWVPSDRREFVYALDGNLTWIDSQWDDYSEAWFYYDWKREMIFDYTFTFPDFILPVSEIDPDPLSIYNDIYFSHELKSIIDYDRFDALSEWMRSSRKSYYYSEQNLTTVFKPGIQDGCIYPNPAVDLINLSFQGNGRQVLLELFDIQGRKIWAKDIQKGEAVSLKGLSKGIYLYKVTGDEVNYKGKLVKD